MLIQNIFFKLETQTLTHILHVNYTTATTPNITVPVLHIKLVIEHHTPPPYNHDPLTHQVILALYPLPSSIDSHSALCSNPTACELRPAAESERKPAKHNTNHTPSTRTSH
jgi:hypothetical protein